MYNSYNTKCCHKEGKLKKISILRLRFVWSITALLIASLACGAPGSNRALISELAADEALTIFKETELEYIEQTIGLHTYDVAPPIGVVNNALCMPEISDRALSTITNVYLPGEERAEDKIFLNDGSVTRAYTRFTIAIFCRTTVDNFVECIEFQPGGFDLRVFSPPSNPDELQVSTDNLCYSLNYRQQPASALVDDDPKEEAQTEAHDDCNLSAYLDLQIEVTQNFVNEYNTHLCEYSVYFNNTHTESAGIPIIKVHELDCFQDLDTYSYWALDSVPPGGQTAWTLGATSDHDDEDCPSRISGWFLVLAGMLVDDDPCVQAYLRSNAFREGYTEQVGFPVSAPPAGCPLP
jgi:hypothetical protein